MVLITRCCCWNSVRRGSFASGIFTLAMYLILLTSSVFHVNSAADSPELLTMSIFMLLFSFFCVVSSVLLLVGLCVDNRLFLLPWIASVSATTLLDFALALYLIPDMIENPAVGALFATDLIFCAINVYCIICVISQYQQYLAGRGRAGQRATSQPIPTVRLQPDVSNSRNVPSVSYQVSRNGNATCLLTVPSPNSSSMTSKSPVPTDMSSISEDPSSNDASRKVSSDDASSEVVGYGAQSRWKTAGQSLSLSSNLGKADHEYKEASSPDITTSVTLVVPTRAVVAEHTTSAAHITIKVESDDGEENVVSEGVKQTEDTES